MLKKIAAFSILLGFAYFAQQALADHIVSDGIGGFYTPDGHVVSDGIGGYYTP